MTIAITVTIAPTTLINSLSPPPAYLVNDDGARWMLETLQDKGFKMPGDIALAWDWYGWLHGTSIKTSFHHESLFSYVQGHGR